MAQYSIKIRLKLPDTASKLIILLVLFYRLLRYGYTFRLIPLTQDKYAKVDQRDCKMLNQHKWFAMKKGCSYYAATYLYKNGNRRRVYMHRLIMFKQLKTKNSKLKTDFIIDHKNRNSLDNRRANLRLATKTQNNWNCDRWKNKRRSKYIGISYRPKKKKYQAGIYIENKYHSLGYYDNEVSAAKAYDIAAKKHRAEFAVLNFK